MRSSKRRVDPFLPLEGIAFVLLYFILTMLVLVVGFGVVETIRTGSTSVSVATIGDSDACVTVDGNTVPQAVELQRSEREGVSMRAEEVRLCLQDPTPGQKAGAVLKPLGDLVLVVVGLLLIRRAIRTGRRTRVFSLPFARQVQQLAWFVLASALVWPFVAAAGRGVVLEAAVRDRSWYDALSSPGISLGLVVAGLGLVTVARVLRRAVLLQERALLLQEEVDETV